jgi:hypothetical protein
MIAPVSFIPKNAGRGAAFLLDRLQKSIFDHKGTKSRRLKGKNLVT